MHTSVKYTPSPMSFITILTLSLAISSCVLSDNTVRADDGEADVRVMSFNLRYGKANDGDNVWDNRKALVATTIREFNPDILGTQETLKFQADFVGEQFSEYTAFGRTREKDGEDGEQCAIFYRTERFNKLGGGHLWLSETPKVPGSKSWDSSLPRMVSWLCLRDAKQPDRPICIFNTHFDHRGPTARDESAKLIAIESKKIARSFGNARMIVTGDFNTDEGSKPYERFFADENESVHSTETPAEVAEGTETVETAVADDSAATTEAAAEPVTLTFVDSYRVTHEEEKETEGTFNGFKGTNKGARIDWILIDQRWKVQSASIIDRNDNGRYPSDHFPVSAVLR